MINIPAIPTLRLLAYSIRAAVTLLAYSPTSVPYVKPPAKDGSCSYNNASSKFRSFTHFTDTV